MDTKQQYDSFVMNTYGRTGICLRDGNGATVSDEQKQYIDFGSGIGTNSLGFCDSDWAKAVSEQATKLQHTSNYYYNGPCGSLAEQLIAITEYSKVFFGNSGAEANECAIKLARKYSHDKYGKGRSKILTLTNSFHGRTIATLSATGQDTFHQHFFPFLEGFDYVTANSIDDLKKKADDTVCAIMFEYVQGEGGVLPLSKEFVDAIFQIAAEKDILTIADEVQTGAGRTGEFLAGMCYGKKANITTLAKGLGGGLPIGVCLADDKCKDTLTTGTHGSTFGGNPVVCAGAMTVLKKISDPVFLANVKKNGAVLRETLKQMKKVKSVSGLGMMLGVKLTDITAADVVKAAAEKGLLVLTAKDKLRLLPPLVITDKEINEGLDILAEILN